MREPASPGRCGRSRSAPSPRAGAGGALTTSLGAGAGPAPCVTQLQPCSFCPRSFPGLRRMGPAVLGEHEAGWKTNRDPFWEDGEEEWRCFSCRVTGSIPLQARGLQTASSAVLG